MRDDLHDYADSIHARIEEVLGLEPIATIYLGTFDSIVLHRAGRFQAELVTIAPGTRIATHAHPTTDSIDLLVEGNVARFHLGPHQVSRFVKGIGLRIPANEPHGGTASGAGVCFLSCQRWRDAPSHVALDWAGPAASDVHLLAAALANVQ